MMEKLEEEEGATCNLLASPCLQFCLLGISLGDKEGAV